MRYHSSNSVAYTTYSINGGEYQKEQDWLVWQLKLSAVLAEPLALIRTAVNRLECGLDIDDMGFTPNDAKIVKEYVDFCSFVRQSLRSDGRNTASRVFAVHNLNTGSSFVWAHLVC